MGATPRSFKLTVMLCPRLAHRVLPRHLALHGIQRRQKGSHPGIQSRFCHRPRGCAWLRSQPRNQMHRNPVRQPNAAGWCLDHFRFGRVVARGVGLQSAGNAIEVPLHGLMHAFRQRQVSDRVIDIQKRGRLAY